MNRIVQYFIERPLIVNLLSILLIIVGLAATTGLRRQTYPDVSLEQLQVQTVYPAAAAHDVEVNVTKPLEDKILEVDGVDEVRSVSMENFSFIQIKMDPDVGDKEKAKADVRRAIDQVNSLPEAVTERPNVYESRTSWVPVAMLNLSSNDMTEEELRQIAERMEREIEALPGIAHVDKMGYRDKEIQVKVSPEKLEQYYLSLQEVTHAIDSRNIRLTGGSSESVNNQAAILTLGEFANADEIADVIVRSNFIGKSIRIKDVAQVNDGYEKRSFEQRANGIAGIGLRVHKKESADAVVTMAAVDKYLEESKAILPSSLDVQKLREMTKMTTRRLSILRNNAMLGLVMVMAVLIMFLNMRVALWTAFGIPIALGIGVLTHTLTGGTMDSIALTAFILVLGMLVDDAIVVAENIHRHQEEGMPAMKAALKAVAEVAAPITATVTTTILAFSPMLALGGMLGPFVKMIPIIVAGTLIGSLIESFFILPGHLASGKKANPSKKIKGAIIDPLFKPFRRFYRKVLDKMLTYRYVTLAVAVTILGIGSFIAVTNMKFVLFPQEVAERFFIHVEAKQGSSFNVTRDVVKKVENIVASLPEKELENFETNLGADYAQGGKELFGDNLAYVRVKLTPYGKRERTAVTIMEEVRKQAQQIAGAESILFELDAGGPPVGRPVELNLIGKGVYSNKAIADDILAFLKGIPGVIDPSLDLKYNREENVIKLNYEELARRGLSVKDVAQTVRMAYEGVEVSSLRMAQDDVAIRVQLDDKSRLSSTTLTAIQIRNPMGKMIPLGSLMKLEKRNTIQAINHYQGQQVITISADVDAKIITSNEVLAKVKDAYIDLPIKHPGMRLVVTGEGKESAKTVANMARAGIIAVVAIYFVLVMLLGSLGQPFIVLSAIPFGVVGVLLAFGMQGMAMGFMAMIGLLGMSGVVVNDSLIILSFTNQLAKERKQIFNISQKTILDAAQTRLRPVVLTTLTTTAGLLPTAYGLGGSDPFIVPMVMAMLWGIICATGLTLIWVPLMVSVGQDIRQLFFGKSSWAKEVDELVQLQGDKVMDAVFIKKQEMLEPENAN